MCCSSQQQVVVCVCVFALIKSNLFPFSVWNKRNPHGSNKKDPASLQDACDLEPLTVMKPSPSPLYTHTQKEGKVQWRLIKRNKESFFGHYHEAEWEEACEGMKAFWMASGYFSH